MFYVIYISIKLGLGFTPFLLLEEKHDIAAKRAQLWVDMRLSSAPKFSA